MVLLIVWQAHIRGRDWPLGKPGHLKKQVLKTYSKAALYQGVVEYFAAKDCCAGVN